MEERELQTRIALEKVASQTPGIDSMSVCLKCQHMIGIARDAIKKIESDKEASNVNP